MQVQKLESAKKVLEEAREENKMLKFLDILQQGNSANAKGVTSHEESEESELVSLSLGISLKGKTKGERKHCKREDEGMDKGLRLGLDINLDPVDHAEAANVSSTVSSSGEGGKEEEPSEMWPPSKVLKAMKNVDKTEASQNDQPKKTRVSIRARCDTQTVSKCSVQKLVVLENIA